MDLRLGSMSTLPTFEEPFGKIFAVNAFQFWEEPLQRLKDLRSLLKFGGLMAIAIQPRSPGATEETAREIGRNLVANLTAAGFQQVRLEVKPMKPVSVVCALGVRENGQKGTTPASRSQTAPGAPSDHS